MIVVLGSIAARKDTFDALLKAGLEHVHRSRAEPGCLAHDVHVHAEHLLKLVFVEKWKDATAFATHFKVQGSIDFVVKARALAAEPPVIEIFEATATRLG